jgi:hypothetical protein
MWNSVSTLPEWLCLDLNNRRNPLVNHAPFPSASVAASSIGMPLDRLNARLRTRYD